jgi:FkbM family methyltransferase
VFDVGSNVGSLAESFLDNKAKTCHLFEPAPLLMDMCRTRFEGRKNVVFNQVGVSDKPGRLENVDFAESWVLRPQGELPNLRVSPGAMELQPERFDVELITLDDYLKSVGIRSLGLLKIDVEGYEFRVLKGASKLISKLKPVILLELSFYVESLGDSIPDYIDYLLNLDGYVIRDVHGNLVSETRLKQQYPHHTSCDVILEPV